MLNSPTNRVLLLLVLLAVLGVFDRAWLPWQPGLPGSIDGQARVIDGDSLRLGGHEVRLQGIDAPEARQTCQRDGADWPCGEAAARRLRQLVEGRVVVCRVRKRDRYDRLLADCEAGGERLNRILVAEGWAVAHGAYQSEEQAARTARLGLWAGTFEPPRQWRDRHPR